MATSTFELDSGRITLRIDGTDHAVDLMDLQDLLDECEKANPLPRADGFVSSTPEFRKAVAAAMESKLGIPGVTSTGAWQIWMAVNERVNSLKNSIAGTQK